MSLYLSSSILSLFPLLSLLPSPSLWLLFSSLAVDKSVFVENGVAGFNEDLDQSKNWWLVMTMIYSTTKRGELMLQNPQVWLFLTEFSIENDISLWEKEKLIHSVTLIDNKLQVRCLWKPARWGKAMNSTVACRALCFSGPFINIWTGSQMRPQSCVI